MAPSKQNLFLFFEETENKTVVSRKLVLIYANRCVIDEDAQFEICDVYELEYVSNSMLNFTDPLYELNAGRRDLKEFHDRNTFLEAFEKAYSNESNSIDTHFIIGSSYHLQQVPEKCYLKLLNVLQQRGQVPFNLRVTYELHGPAPIFFYFRFTAASINPKNTNGLRQFIGWVSKLSVD